MPSIYSVYCVFYKSWMATFSSNKIIRDIYDMSSYRASTFNLNDFTPTEYSLFCNELNANDSRTEHLYLKGVNDNHLIRIAANFKSHPCITSLAIGGSLSTVGMTVLIDIIKNNPKIKNIELAGKNIDRGALAQLTNFIAADRQLRHLAIIDNNLGEVGVRELSHALKVNQTLRSLKLNRTHISDTGFNYLLSMLEVNNAIEQLNLISNNITDLSVPTFHERMEFNGKLKNIWLDLNPMSRQNKLAIENYVGNDERRAYAQNCIHFGRR